MILEGPEENRKEALKRVVDCMQHPFKGVKGMPLRVELSVDADYAKSWYEAK